MSYSIKVPEKEVYGKKKYVNASGNTECVEFVRQVTGAPQTALWKAGKIVANTKPGDIPRGTAIATFDGAESYPTDNLGKHAAIYLSHSGAGIRVLDQWNSQGEVKERTIGFNKPKGTPRQNDAATFRVIE
jgi:hypothetical protein